MLTNISYADIATSITSDSTMQGFSTIVTPSGNTYFISGGKLSGSNLFHSFLDFNIGSVDTATFNDVGVTNIITRVTGVNSTNIFGTLNAPSNFFLINPNGVLLGATASINVNGALYVSTADYIKLSDGVEFSASNPGDSSLFTSAPPVAFGFASALPADITVNGTQLYNPNTTAISLIGGNVTIVDGIIYVPDGNIEIVSVASQGEVLRDIKSFDMSGFSSLGTVDISNPSGTFPIIGFKQIGNIDTSGDTGGGIIIRSGRFYLQNAVVKSEVSGGTGLTKGGAIDISVIGEARFLGNSKVSTITNWKGNGGDIFITADSLVMEGNAIVSSDTNDDGSGGVISIDSNLFTMKDSTSLSANTFFDGSGGTVIINTGDMQLFDSSSIRTLTAFPCTISGCSKDAGNITINASTISMYGDATLDTGTFVSSDGNAGNIIISAEELNMNDDSWLISNTFTDSNAGLIKLNVNRITMRDRSAIATSSFSNGNGGTINVNGQILSMSDSSVITSGTEGSGTAGNVVINLDELNNNGNSIISSESEGSNIFVRSAVNLTNATGGGDGGQVIIDASLLKLDENAQIRSGTGGTGIGGDVILSVSNMNLNSASKVSAISTGTGDAGNIEITALDSVILKGGAVTTETENADGGSISVNAEQMIYLVNGTITTSVNGGAGNGGNINIDPVYVVLKNSQIIANANAGNGGNITIVAENFIRDQISVVEASSKLGINGTVSIESPNQEVVGNRSDLPDSFLQELELASQQCALKTRSNISSLVISGHEGLPYSPEDLLPARIGGSNDNSKTTRQSYVVRDVNDLNNPDIIRKLIVMCGAKGSQLQTSF